MSAADWSILVVAALLVGFAKTAIGGVGTMSVALFAAVLPARESTGALLPLLLLGDLVAVSAYRRHADWPTLLRLIPSVAAGIFVGVAFVAWADDVVMRRTIGAVLLGLLGVHLLQRWQARKGQVRDEAAGEVYTHLGSFTGSPPEKRELTTVARVLEKTARYAAPSGISVGVQPVNRFENYLVNTAAGAEELVDRLGEPNVFVHLDTFHMNIEEKGFRDPILRLGERLRYVHLSDRGTPGSGNVRWDELFAALSETGFDGRLVLESFVHPDPEMVRLAAL